MLPAQIISSHFILYRIDVDVISMFVSYRLSYSSSAQSLHLTILQVCIVSHRIILYHLVSYHFLILLYLIVSYHIVLHHLVSYRFILDCIVLYGTVSYCIA